MVLSRSWNIPGIPASAAYSTSRVPVSILFFDDAQILLTLSPYGTFARAGMEKVIRQEIVTAFAQSSHSDEVAAETVNEATVRIDRLQLFGAPAQIQFVIVCNCACEMEPSFGICVPKHKSTPMILSTM